MHASAFWTRAERCAERLFKVEHGANMGPLLHVACYYGFLLSLAVPGVVTSTWLRVFLWVLVVLLNYSLTVGVLHLHCHRPLFTSRVLNRGLDWLLCFPSLVTSVEMTILHVSHHHRFDDGPDDITSTEGLRRGWRVVVYWLWYGTRVKAFVVHELFRRDAPRSHQTRRAPFLLDWVGCAIAGLAFGYVLPEEALWLWAVPLLLTHLTTGYFAWLTHGPAGEGKLNGSMNTVNNWLGLFIFNQGYHAVHHRYPGIHWTEIPDKLELMEEVDSQYIVPYWVTANSMWRILAPETFRNAPYGERWKTRYRSKRAAGRLRLKFLPYFVWI